MKGEIRRATMVCAGILSVSSWMWAADTISVAGTGSGLWVQHARPKMRIQRINASGSEKRMTVEFTLANGAKRVFEGKLAGQGESSFLVKISHSGKADAHGSVWIGTATNDEVNAAYASGTIDGQPFLGQFSGQQSSRLNFLTEGAGSLSRAGGKADDWKLAGFGVMSDLHAHASLVFFLADGSQRRFTGNVKKKIAKPRAVIVGLKYSGEANASGDLRIRFTEKNHVLSVAGPGKLDGQPFKIDFQAALEPAERAEVFEEKLATLAKTSGDVKRGDAATQFTAWSDDTGVRFVEALVDLGDYGSSHRKLYFENRKLIYFSEKGQLRDTAATAKSRMNLVETAVAFSEKGKPETASKMVNGKAVKLGVHDAAGAVAYAEMMRKAVEAKVHGK